MGTHWKKLTNPDYIGAYAFEPGEEKTGTISQVCQEAVTGPDGKKEECTVAHFLEDELKPLILNATNCKTIARLYKTPYIEEWAGKRIIMKVQQVRAFGEVVDAVRIKLEVPPAIPAAPVCRACGAAIRPFGGRNPAELAAYTQEKYGRALCAECAAKEKGKNAAPFGEGRN